MANKQSRMKEILQILSTRDSETVKNLAELINVSEMTIRRDINYLSKSGYVNVFHGGVSINTKQKNVIPNFQYSPYLLDNAVKESLNEKIKIAEYAVSLIEPFDAIGIDSGSTCQYMLDSMQNVNNCVVYTYSMQVLLQASNIDSKNVHFFCFGGLYHRDIKMFESPDVLEIVKKTHINKLFIGAVGVSAEYGLSCAERYEVDMRRTLMSVSDQIILLSDSSKIDKVWPIKYGNLSDVDILITDNRITDEQRDNIEKHGVKVYIA
jgi:DeoR family deoxyribose operon repressor